MSLFGSHDRNVPLWDLGFIARIGAVMALQTFMSLHSCKFGVGVGSLYGIPTFRWDVGLRCPSVGRQFPRCASLTGSQLSVRVAIHVASSFIGRVVLWFHRHGAD